MANGLAIQGQATPPIDGAVLQQVIQLLSTGQVTPDQLLEQGIPPEIIERAIQELQAASQQQQTVPQGLAGQGVM